MFEIRARICHMIEPFETKIITFYRFKMLVDFWFPRIKRNYHLEDDKELK